MVFERVASGVAAQDYKLAERLPSAGCFNGICGRASFTHNMFWMSSDPPLRVLSTTRGWMHAMVTFDSVGPSGVFSHEFGHAAGLWLRSTRASSKANTSLNHTVVHSV